jgi:hypothetical protein
MTTYHGEMNMLRTFKMFHGGNGTNPVDTGGLPLQGIFYGLKGSSNLEWNRYLGQGEPWWHLANERNWDFKTGNLIHNDFGNIYAHHVFGCGDGVIIAVRPNGNLHWYLYLGNGNYDTTHRHDWYPNSGNVIGNGWHHFRHIFVRPYSGRSSTAPARLVIFAVDEYGNLLWFSYNGNGEGRNPSGFPGWHPNSGNRIGSGWARFRHILGTGRDIFAINEDGDMQWFQYNGNGEENPSGSLGWHPNSGRVINPVWPWQDMKYIFGGATDLGGNGSVIMAVDEYDNLYWFKYTGQGEGPDLSLYWHPNSGNRIGRVPFTTATDSVVVHFKSLLPLSVERMNWIEEQFKEMHDLFAQGGIAVYRGSTEDLSNLQHLRNINVGQCRRNEPSAQIEELFKNRNYVGTSPNELVVYLVDNITTDSPDFAGGCATHPREKPGAVVNCNYSPHGTGDARRFAWLVAHEVAHVLGLNHSTHQDNLMFEGLRFTNFPPQLTYTDFNRMHGSPYCRQCQTIVGTNSVPSCC